MSLAHSSCVCEGVLGKAAPHHSLLGAGHEECPPSAKCVSPFSLCPTLSSGQTPQLPEHGLATAQAARLPRDEWSGDQGPRLALGRAQGTDLGQPSRRRVLPRAGAGLARQPGCPSVAPSLQKLLEALPLGLFCPPLSPRSSDRKAVLGGFAQQK